MMPADFDIDEAEVEQICRLLCKWNNEDPDERETLVYSTDGQVLSFGLCWQKWQHNVINFLRLEAAINQVRRDKTQHDKDD